MLPLGLPDNDLIVSGAINPGGDLDFYQVSLHRGDVLGVAMNSYFDSFQKVTQFDFLHAKDTGKPVGQVLTEAGLK